MREIKPDAKILDATAGNRHIWKVKDDSRIVFMDIESELEVKPDIIGDCTKTDYPDGYFHTIFFDPPHWGGDVLGDNFFTLRNKQESIAFSERYGTKRRGASYYGTDKFQTATQLLSFIHRAQKEFYRILNYAGCLWVKWVEKVVSLDKILPLFRDWNLMLKFMVNSNLQTLGDSQCYWLMFMKKPRTHIQTELDQEMKKT